MNKITLLSNQSGGGTSFIIMIILMFGVMWFFMIRPQMKRQKKEKTFRDNLKKGDKVITVGGIHGKIVDLSENSVIIEGNGVKLKISRSHISMI